MTAIQNGKLNYRETLNTGFSPNPGEPEWLQSLRKTAYERFKTLGFPTRKHEDWKYIYLDGILNRTFTPIPLFKKPETRAQKPEHLVSGYCSLVSQNLDDVLLATDLSKADWAKDYLAYEATPEINPFVPINTFQFQDGIFIRIPKETVIQEPLHLIFTPCGNNQKPPVFYPRILVVAEAGSQFELTLHTAGQNSESYFMNSVIEFVLKPNASVSCAMSQDENEQAIQFLNARAHLQEGSRLEMTGIVTGGSMTRNDLHVNLDGAEAFCSLAGLSVLGGRSQAFHQVTVNHRFMNCTSRQVYKNILAGESVAEFNSLVHVWRCAQKSDAEQLDKNLLLSDGARVYSRPQLKIDNDDVRASHGAATGKMEEDELFYLRSRGLPKDLARFLLISGFAQEVLAKVKPEAVRKEWTAQIEQKIRQIV